MRSRHLALCALLALTSAACGGDRSSPNWDGLAKEFLEAYFESNPHEAVYLGKHEYDGRLPDWSREGLKKQATELRAFKKRIEAFDVTGFDSGQALEREHLLSVADSGLFWLEKARWPERNPAFYRGGLDPNTYLNRPYAPLPERMAAYIRWAQAIPGAVEQIRANLRAPLPKTYLYIGRITFGGLASYLEEDVPAIFAGVEDSELQAQFVKANATAKEAFESMDSWLEGQEAQATDDFALGADLFQEMLRTTERVDVSLEELETAGRVDLERNLEALEEACALYAPGLRMLECARKAQAHKPADGPVMGARRQLEDLEEFVRRENIVSIPGTERAQVEEAPPYRRSNAAYIDIPGPYEENLPSVYYIAPPDPSWTPEEQAAYIPGTTPLLFISVHEVWPGHFLQFLHTNRASSELGRIFVGYAFAEGWAHYTEEMMWEAGYGKETPETHVGQLLNALRRNARYLSAIGLHARGMTVEESEQMFLEKAFADIGNARQQAARGTYDPGYLNYTLGKLMIRRLREDWTRDRGGREAWREFHDQFLSYGGPPIPLVRRAMLGEAAGPAL